MSNTFAIEPGDPHIRYGLYLRPSFAMARAIGEMHGLMERQYGQTRAGKYMPHSTIGFFRSYASVQDLITAVDPILRERSRFIVQNHGVIASPGQSILLNIHFDDNREPNPALMALHNETQATLYPLTDKADRHHWTGEGFHAHMTLVQRVRPAHLFVEMLAFLQAGEPIGPRRFVADRVHLYAVRSDDWQDEEWSDSLTWSLLHSWKLV